jgi:hypothetical protein
MTCPQNCDFVRMDAGTKDEPAWCGMMAKLGGELSRRSTVDDNDKNDR